VAKNQRIKVLVTGSNGLLGQTLVNLLLLEKDRYQVIGLSKGENRNKQEGFDYISLDITHAVQFKETLLKVAPAVLVHTAAMTNVDLCETQQAACKALNIDTMAVIVAASQQLNTHVIHVSTDFVFDGEKGLYKETDTVNPLSYYGMSKLKSEEILTNGAISHTILRTILVYGKVLEMTRNNIVCWLLEVLQYGKQVQMVADQYRAPTYVEDLAIACKKAMDIKAQGLFHFASNTLLSIYEMAQQVAEVFGEDARLIQPISTKTLSQTASRPPKTGFNLEKTRTVLGIYPKSFKEDLQRFKEKLSKENI